MSEDKKPLIEQLHSIEKYVGRLADDIEKQNSNLGQQYIDGYLDLASLIIHRIHIMESQITENQK